MLQSMRASAQGKIGRVIMAILMGLIILSFAIWGIGDIFRGFGANNLARVGGIEIGADTYRNAYQAELQTLARAEHRNVTNEEAHQYGLDRQVLSQLVNEATLDDQARRLGLAISDEDIKKTIVNDPNFKGMTGRFDRQAFAAFLRGEGLTEKSYVRQQRSVRLHSQIVDALTAGVQLPKALLETIFRFQMETRSVDYIEFHNASAGPPTAPSQEELKRY
ncbi:MAG: SurA N-terminal domain-containing protein, partial [Methylocella sp.]